MSEKKPRIKDFESSLNDLETIVRVMEDGELSLEESLKQFENGIKLARECQDTLSNAELKVEQLIEKNGLQQTVPFEESNDD
ncbi:MAG: exodeoxyribonuclease VII small subunit [Gammaproteobacteria bacterium]|jgi:exodeoxyribonuclease VII small subunit